MKNNVSSRIIAIMSVIVATSLFYLHQLLFIVMLPAALILGVFSLLQARREKSSYLWGIAAIIVTISMFFVLKIAMGYKNEKIEQDICKDFPEEFECINRELKTKNPSIY